ncbi:putative RNA-directed DNA polymerase, eukaryota, reverse transcriptase zinc-binding domain protein [Tanacetum coccineum]
MCSNEGFVGVDFKYLGGLWVLFDFTSKMPHQVVNIQVLFSSLKAWSHDLWWRNDLFGLRLKCNRLSKRICIKSSHALLIFATILVTLNKVTYAIRVRELCSWTPSFINNDSDSEDANSIGLFEKQGDNLSEENDNFDLYGFPGEHTHRSGADGPFQLQPGFSLLARLEETIKVGLALGLNMEGCLGDLNKMRWIRDLCHKHMVNFLAIQESKMVKADLCMFRQVDYYLCPDKRRRATRDKMLFLSSLLQLTVTWDGILVMMGDFNEVRRACDRVILEKGIPDHRPILLKESHVDYGPTPFRFFHSWLEMEGFQNLVVDTWNNDVLFHANGFVLVQEEASKSQTCYSGIDHGTASEDDFINRRDALKSLGDLARMEARYLSQKTKTKWALEGDENTKFFYGIIKKRRRQLAIKGIIRMYPIYLLDTDISRPLSPSQRDFLERPFSRDEIKRAVWDCGGDRAPGPDGFTFKFFTSFWDLIQDDVVSFVQEFSRSNLLPKGCNSSFIALIPKLLANRLSSVIGDCVSSVQSAFIKDRNTLDGPLILNEFLAWYRQRKKKLMVFKVDFEKAFDSVRWDYLDLIMDKLGFSLKWRAWINGCLHNVRSSVLINGSPTKEFEVFRGLRQGDPMSHFLFILAMEGLHALTSKAEALGLFKGASIGKDNMSISQLMYADDVIFFGEWSWINAHNLISMLRCFFLISGLQINIHKSNVLGVGVTDEEVSYMANIIGCGASKFPMKYLGVLVGCNMARCFNWNAIINKFSSKLSSWKVRLLSVGGRLSLIKSVLEVSDVALGAPFFLRLIVSNQKVLIFFPTVLARLAMAPPRGGAESAQFNSLKDSIGNIILTDQHDSWQWSLDVSKGFSVASVRQLVDSHILVTGNEATRWNRSLPIKVNVFLWRLKLNKLSSRVNLVRRGIEISSLLCPLCLGDFETVNHSFFNCDLAKGLWSLFAKWWEVDIPACGNIAEWYEWLGGLHVSSNVRLFLEGVGGTIMWAIWNFRNLLIFSSPPPKKATLWDYIVSQSYLWISSRNPNCVRANGVMAISIRQSYVASPLSSP